MKQVLYMTTHEGKVLAVGYFEQSEDSTITFQSADLWIVFTLGQVMEIIHQYPLGKLDAQNLAEVLDAVAKDVWIFTERNAPPLLKIESPHATVLIACMLGLVGKELHEALDTSSSSSADRAIFNTLRKKEPKPN